MARKDWKQPLTLSLSKETLKLLRKASRDAGVSRSLFVEAALQYYVEVGKRRITA